jgi:tetratricopeptide (TPR) repeat protein
MTLIHRLPAAAVAAIAALVVFAGLALALALTRGGAPAQLAPAGDETEFPRTTDGTIAKAQSVLAGDPRDVPALEALAGASLDKARETGDPSWSTKAGRAAARALAADPRSFDAMDVLGTLALTRHRFGEALEWSSRSLAVAPTRVAPLSIRADALIELGRYPEGFAAVERRVGLRPDLPSYSRASYALELRGDRAGAIRYMRLAVGAGAIGSESRAWARVQLGLLLFGGGDLAGAEREMRGALAERPRDARATAGLAKALAARGQLDHAAALYATALATLPLPEYPAALAEIDAARGDRAGEARELGLVRAMQRLLAASGSVVDLDLALIEADFSAPTAPDVALARRARATRPGVIGDQVLGWVLTRAGRCAEADRYATRSLRLGTRDALMLFHAGMAASCAGHAGAARERLSAALALNPRFSVRWAPVARRELARLS